jgi:hypothetical protein
MKCDPWVLILACIFASLCFGCKPKARVITPLRNLKYVMEPKGFRIYFNKGITCALNNYGHKHYPSNSLDQNNSINGVYKLPS